MFRICFASSSDIPVYALAFTDFAPSLPDSSAACLAAEAAKGLQRVDRTTYPYQNSLPEFCCSPRNSSLRACVNALPTS